MRIRRTGVFFLSAFALVSLSCVKAPPKTVGVPRPPAEAETLIQNYRKQNSLRSLSAFADVSVEYRGRKEFFSAAVLAQSPDRLRIELLNDLGETLGRLISDGKTVTWWEARTDEVSEFTSGDPALQKVFRVPLSVEEFIDRLLLQFPEGEVLDFQEAEELQWIGRAGDRLGFARSPLLLKAYEKKKTAGKDTLRYRVDYVYSSPTSASYPSEMKWSFFKPRFQMTFQLREAAWNEKLAPVKFHPYPNAP